MRVYPIGRYVRAVAASLLLALALAPAAGAEEVKCVGCKAWWHLNLDSAPAVLQPGQAQNEIQEVSVKATGGTFLLEAGGKEHHFPWDATHQELQEGLEEIYGAGNVEVPRGRGNETGSEPYEVIFKGGLADRSRDLIATGGSVAITLTGPGHNVAVKEVAHGRPDATLILSAQNMSGADLTGPVAIAAKLPPGLTPLAIDATGGFIGGEHLECTLEALSCVDPGVTFPYEQLQLIIPVNVKPGAHSGEPVELTVSGGNALPARAAHPIAVGASSPSFGLENYEMSPEDEGGGAATQAGSHPFQLTTTLMLNQRVLDNPRGSSYEPEQLGMSKDISVKLPPGLVGNPTVFPQCTVAQFTKAETFVNECPNDTAVGVAAVTVRLALGSFSFATVTVPVFNLTPANGEPARFGFEVLDVPVFLDTSVRTGGDYGVTVKVTNISQQALFVGSRVTFWGVPGDPRHDQARGWSCLADGTWQPFLESVVPPCSRPVHQSPPPLLELPTSCTGPLATTAEVDSWEHPGSFLSSGPFAPLPALDGCNALPFTPSISVAPDGQAGSTPTGLTVGIHVPQEVSLDAEGLGEADVKDTTVTLPAGIALNPAAADGLQACSEAQVALNVHAPPECPDPSKVGTVEIHSPLLPNPLLGFAYLAAQDANPFGSLVALYIVAQDPVSGTLVKLAGEVKPDPVTGQLISTFKNTPQLPFEDFRLHFFGGDRAPLSTPGLCGTYRTSAAIAPWSGGSPAEPTSPFAVTSGPNGSPCSNPLPFAPSLTGGTTNLQAGAFSPLTTTINRQDGQQGIQSVQIHYPAGLEGILAGVKLCGEAEADAGTCGPESELGETTVSVGLGGDPFSVKGGKVYITGPYRGAPFGLSIVNPAKAGPYDLGKVVVRAKIEVDPRTAALTVTTDDSGPYAIPHILDGIPLQIKHVNVTITRPGFTFNPTNCNPLSLTATVASDEGATSPVSQPFQVTNCAALKFTPSIAVATAGHASRANGASLFTKITYPKGALGSQAWINEAKLQFPRQLSARLTTLQKACLAHTFETNRSACPAPSIIGHALVRTPVLPVPLQGPVYFVSYGGAKFPDAVIVLDGYGVHVELHGETFIQSSTGITTATFRNTPDVPFESLEVTIPTGQYSEFAANLPGGKYNFCGQKLTMPVFFRASNGAEIHQNASFAITGCAPPPSRHRQLVNALKACRKRHGHGRAACERAARRAYGPRPSKRPKR